MADWGRMWASVLKEHGIDALYTPAAGDPVSLRVVRGTGRRTARAGAGPGISVQANQAWALRADLPATLTVDADTITIDPDGAAPETFTVRRHAPGEAGAIEILDLGRPNS